MTPNLTMFFEFGWTSAILEEFFRVVCISVGELLLEELFAIAAVKPRHHRQ